MFRNMASSLFLTERDAEFEENAPKIKGRIKTTLHKAKEVRALVEKCITIARKSLKAARAAEELKTSAERGSDEWNSWRNGDGWQEWNQAIAPAVNARRRAYQILQDKLAVQVLFDEIAPRFENREGGYTRILKLATPRLGDAGAQAILELVGVHDRVQQKSEKPSFSDEAEETTAPVDEAPVDEAPAEEAGDEESKDE
ncbi:MAG: large subunit ribosomal protein L17 [Pirellulaceae bacterium]|jgi:large subunit ribosomal protein L17